MKIITTDYGDFISSPEKEGKSKILYCFVYTKSRPYMFILVSVVNICTYIHLHMFPLISTFTSIGLGVLMKDKGKEGKTIKAQNVTYQTFEKYVESSSFFFLVHNFLSSSTMKTLLLMSNNNSISEIPSFSVLKILWKNGIYIAHI